MISPKYKHLHPPLVQRIVDESANIKEAKTRLHQIFGAYINDNSHKKAEKLLATPLEILKLHASTKERLAHYPQFYNFLATHAPDVQYVLDIGCGFNPFALAHMPWTLKSYTAVDIDNRTAGLLNQFFATQPIDGRAYCMDVVSDCPVDATDMVLLHKLLPVLEAQRKGRGEELLKVLDFKYAAVSFPIKSLGGREKGMEQTYGRYFEELSGIGRLLAQDVVGNELVYVVKK